MHPFGPQRLECCESLVLIVAKEVPYKALRCSSGAPQCIQVTRMPLAAKALCKQAINNFRT